MKFDFVVSFHLLPLFEVVNSLSFVLSLNRCCLFSTKSALYSRINTVSIVFFVLSIMRVFTALAVRTFLCLFVSTLVVQGKTPSLELVASFARQATGVSVHPPSGRIFVNFPRWTEDAPISVAEVFPPNTIVPFPPNSQWNSWRNPQQDELDPTKHFVCVQSVYAFGDSLFVLDPAAPGLAEIVSNGPKIVEIDLNTNQTKRTILIDETVAPRTSYMNDIRISPCGHWAYITDSGVVGALIVVNLKTGEAKRLLHGHPTTQADLTV